MGIRGLKTFIEQRCSDGTVSVNISDIVEKNLIESDSNQACLVVDTYNCMGTWYEKTDMYGFTGGQWKEYQIVLQNFITDCKKIKLDLIFFIDGTTELSKKAKWFERYEGYLRDIENLFSFLDIGVIQKHQTFPSSLSDFTKYILKSLGQRIIVADGDADYDIMKFAVESLSCIGVLAEDSDYLAYLGGKPVFTSDHFHPESNKALMWYKPALLHALSLEEGDMPVFACLMGNDLTTEHSEDLMHFKKRLGGEWFLSVAHYLNEFKMGDGYNLKKLQDEVLPNCEDFIFSTIVRSYLLPDNICPWINSDINIIGNESSRTNKFQCSVQILQEAKLHSSWSYELLKFGANKLLPSIEKDIFESQWVVYRYIRERLYGIVLTETESENKYIEEWIGYKYNGGVELCYPSPVMYQGKQVSLHQLRLPNCTRNDKIHIFEQCVGLVGHEYALKKVSPDLPEYLLISSYLLCYMANKIVNLTRHDLTCLVECVISCSDTSILFIKQLPKVKPTSRPVVLASHYCHGLHTLLEANNICGQPFKYENFIPTNTFDGSLFQNIYQKPIEFKKTPNDFRKTLMDLCLDR